MVDVPFLRRQIEMVNQVLRYVHISDIKCLFVFYLSIAI